MSSLDRVLAECGAAPDDDAPRLVWADLVGGERGELVVLQCDLARGGLAPAEAAARRRRERELLAKHAVEWAGGVAAFAKRWSFRRGFVEAACIDLAKLEPARVEEWPLLTSITIDPDVNDQETAGLERFAPHLCKLRGFGLRLHPNRLRFVRILAAAGCERLRALDVEGLDEQMYPALLAIVKHAPIECLRLRDRVIDDEQLGTLLDAAPRLRALEVTGSVSLELFMHRPLRALAIAGVDDEEVATFERGSEVLEHLQVVSYLPTRALGMLARFPALRSLEIAVPQDAHIDHVLDQIGPQLERLVVAMPDHDGQRAAFQASADRRRTFAGELRAAQQWEVRTALGSSLVHESPAAIFDVPCSETGAPVTFVSLVEDTSWNVPRFPVDVPVFLGRHPLNFVQIMSKSVGRHHARLCWVIDHHEVEDLNTSGHGIFVNGKRDGRASLRDGDLLDLGKYSLQYFVGDGAEVRGERVLLARRRNAPFERAIGSMRDERCNELARGVSLEPSRMPAVANALADCLIRRVLACPGRYATYSERPALRALAPIHDAASRAAARAALASEDSLHASGSTSMALDLIDELENASEPDRDAIWQRLFHEAGPMFMAVSRAERAGIAEMPQLIAETLESLVR